MAQVIQHHAHTLVKSGFQFQFFNKIPTHQSDHCYLRNWLNCELILIYSGGKFTWASEAGSCSTHYSYYFCLFSSSLSLSVSSPSTPWSTHWSGGSGRFRDDYISQYLLDQPSLQWIQWNSQLQIKTYQQTSWNHSWHSWRRYDDDGKPRQPPSVHCLHHPALCEECSGTWGRGSRHNWDDRLTT